MFYDKFIALCEERGIKPSPLLRSLGYSATNLKKWQNGGTITSGTLEDLARYFDVPVGYFFDDNISTNGINVIEENNTIKVVFNAIKSQPNTTVSLMTGRSLSAHTLSRISNYLNYPPDYLVKNGMSDGVGDIENESDIPDDIISPKELILNILAKVPASEEYNYLQVRISTIIIKNLGQKGITKENLLEMGLVKKKIRDLYDFSMAAEKKIGLNYSDLMNILEKFHVSYDFMLTGHGE